MQILNVQNFIRNFITKTRTSGVVLGLSGGVDSAVVAMLCKNSGVNFHCLLMPAKNSSQNHFNDALELCRTHDFSHEILSIADYENAFFAANPDPETPHFRHRHGNFCARIRANLLYDASFSRGAVVIGTANKSERMLGYGTLHGDLACALNPIGDFFKTEIFAMARLLNLPEIFTKKPPSADLFVGQSDECDLGFSYEKIDDFLRAVFRIYPDFFERKEISADFLRDKLSEFDKNLVEKLTDRMNRNFFKHSTPEIFIRINEK